MNKLQSAKKIVEQNGTCLGIACSDCIRNHGSCHEQSQRLQLAKQYINENSVQEYKYGEKILVDGDLERIFVAQLPDGSVLCLDDNWIEEFKAGDEYNAINWKTHQPLTRTELRYIEVKEMVAALLDNEFAPSGRGDWCHSNGTIFVDQLSLCGTPVENEPFRAWMVEEVEIKNGEDR